MTTDTTVEPTSTTDPQKVVLAWTNALNDHDANRAATFFTEDAVFTNTGSGRRYEGPAIRDDFDTLLTMWGDIHFEKTNWLIVGDRFADEWVVTGVHSGDIPGLSATHRPFRLTGASVGRVRGNQIAAITVYFNMADFLMQVGLLPQNTPE
jgi:hypothetical protein